jgi:putative oxidoreductase
MMNLNNYEIALTIARVFLGVLFFLQGYDKVFRIGLQKVAQAFETELAHANLPSFIIIPAAYFTSYTELLGGFFLIAGFAKYYALYALGIDLVMVAVAMGLINPLWKMDFVFPRLALLLFLLCMPPAAEFFSLDHWLGIFRNR